MNSNTAPRMAGRSEDDGTVIAQHLQPGVEIGLMTCDGGIDQTAMAHDKGAAKLGHQLLECLGRTAKAAAEGAAEAARMAGPVDQLVQHRNAKGFRTGEARRPWQPNLVGFRERHRLFIAKADGRAAPADQAQGPLDGAMRRW
ncbi:hypothetical protein GmRootV213_49980 (plasmid) [Variovorax sp. V213]